MPMTDIWDQRLTDGTYGLPSFNNTSKTVFAIEVSDILIVSQNNHHTVRSSGPVLNFQGYLELRRHSIHISD